MACDRGGKWPNDVMEPLFELTVSTAPRGSRLVAAHLFRQLRDAIVDGRLPPGTQLPSTRAASGLFGVARNTVQDVYDRLAMEGLTLARQGAGTFVGACPPTAPPAPQPPAAPPPCVGNPVWQRPDLQAWIGFWQGDPAPAEPVAIVADLRPALVDQRLFPHATFRQVMARQLRRSETAPPSTRSPQGNRGNHRLRQAIVDHIGLTRAVACGADDVLVTAGAQQAFDLIARTLVVPGETVVAIEDPGYPPLRVPFAAAGARLVPVRVDGEGIVVDDIPPDASVICVCPSHHFPLGMPLSPRRRAALLARANRTGAVIVEDDYDGEFRYGGSPLEALRTGAAADRVFFVGSFSKSMLPSIRLGFLVAPQWALPALIAAKNASDWHCPSPVQMAVGAFIRDGHLARHIRRMRRTYQNRRRHLLDLLDRHVGRTLHVVPSFYGMHVAAVADAAVDPACVSRALALRGVMIHTLDRYYLGEPDRRGFVLGYAAVDSETLTRAVRDLADLLPTRDI